MAGTFFSQSVAKLTGRWKDDQGLCSCREVREPEGELGGHWVSGFREDFSQKTLKGRRWNRGAQESTCNMWDMQAV